MFLESRRRLVTLMLKPRFSDWRHGRVQKALYYDYAYCHTAARYVRWLDLSVSTGE